MLAMTQLAGFGAGSRGVTSLTQEGSNTSTASTITGPAAIVAGDLLVLLDRATDSGSTTPAAVVPTGFVPFVDSVSFITSRMLMSYKIADGSEASASLTGMNGTTSNSKALYVFRGDIPITAVGIGWPDQERTAGNPASKTVLATNSPAPVVVLGAYRSTAAVDPRTFSPAKDGEITPDSGLLYLAYRIDNTTPQDTSVDMDDEGVNILASAYLNPNGFNEGYPLIQNIGVSNSPDLTNQDPATVVLPAGIVSGNLLLMHISLYKTSAVSVNTPTGWTQLYHTTGGGDMRASAVYYRVADGSEGASVSVDFTATAQWAAQVFRITNYQGTPEAGTSATGSSTSPDPPSLSPSWGSQKTLWLGTVSHISTALLTAFPSSYQSLQPWLGQALSNVVASEVIWRRNETGTENPGAVTIASAQWVANTVAVRGA